METRYFSSNLVTESKLVIPEQNATIGGDMTFGNKVFIPSYACKKPEWIMVIAPRPKQEVVRAMAVDLLACCKR